MSEYLEFQPDHAPEMLCANARLAGRPVAIIANRRGFLNEPRIGGIIYTESARKVVVLRRNRRPAGRFRSIYLQDVSGFMVGPEAEQSRHHPRRRRDGGDRCPAPAVPKIVLTINHASGAGYYAMAGQGFDPNFTFSWPTARIGVMEGDSAVQALYSVEIEKYKSSGDADSGGIASRRSNERAPTTSAGSMRAMRRPGATWTP